MYLYTAPDPLAAYKETLTNKINEAKAINTFAKSAETVSVLNQAISDGEAALVAVGATEQSLTAAVQAISDAIAGLELADGYTNLTVDMFKTWDSNTEPTSGTSAGCAYVLNESTGMPFGDVNVDYKNFADISDFNKLYILIDAGQARIQMNRETDGGTTHIVYSNGIGVTEVDFATEDQLKGFDYVHLNAIKDNWGGVTVSGMYLYRTITVGTVGYSTFGSLSKTAKLNGVKGYAAKYENGYLKLAEVTNVPAGKGIIIEAAAGSYAPTFDVAASDIASDLKVSNGTVKGGANIYALANGTHGVGFYQVDESVTIPAGKAYLEVTAGAREFIGFSFDEATGINEVVKAEKSNAIYNLSGQRMAQPVKGLNIVNGKKFMVK